ncbi:MAG: type II toxin-antitoxin system RelE/ParE family toxin [Vulcanimicrobiaceae bacterium]
MAWDVEFTDQFEEWWGEIDADAQADIDAAVQLLAEFGPTLGRPHVDTVNGSRHANMKELIVQSNGRPFRAFFAFDPRRTAILLIGGDKTGQKRFYEEMIPIADRLYGEHLQEIQKEDAHDG